MENSLRIAEPVALARPRGAHRYEAFSPKLSRRLTLYTRPALEQWILLEANPAVVTFCERPGFVQLDGHRCLADFWVHYVDRQELVLLNYMSIGEEMTDAARELDGKALAIRRVASAELVAARAWVGNWRCMLPCLIANRKLVLPSLSRPIERFLDKPKRLADVEREFSTGDPVLVRAALFGLLHQGKVCAPELHTQPLSLLTSFVATKAIS
ncbi:hypothetical protein P0D72_28605 [Paraburkholderia sediminicola]|uniref:hypothetical protein n=1 Tax=Paraburkholderia sediminicola TaxID=458836 RepID=UPI0038B80888